MNRVTQSISRKSHLSTALPSYIFHEDFNNKKRSEINDIKEFDKELKSYDDTYMPDEMTRQIARKMHYAAHRMHNARTTAQLQQWQSLYHKLRDAIVLGNRKLIYRAVRRRMSVQNQMEDLIGDCHIVFIQVVAAYNPWLGIRFSTYAYTCLVRALSRISQKSSNDWLARSLPLDGIADLEPNQAFDPEPVSNSTLRLSDYLRDEHPLLSTREKTILSRRFSFCDSDQSLTLEQVGNELGLSKERVRQLQALALGKLRKALDETVVKA